MLYTQTELYDRSWPKSDLTRSCRFLRAHNTAAFDLFKTSINLGSLL